MQHEVTTPQPLLRKDGTLSEEGWARDPLWQYDRSAVAARRLRIKEWDYYHISNGSQVFALTVADLGYAAFGAVALIDLNRATARQGDSLLLFRRLDLPATSEGSPLTFTSKQLSISCTVEAGRRRLRAESSRLLGGFKAEFEIEDNHEESMVIATSWAHNRRKFYYNQKKNTMPVSGRLELSDGSSFSFERSDSLAGLDWGRGNWSYKNRWYWASAAGYSSGRRTGFNLGYGFTDRSPASEDVLFVDGRVHKLDRVSWHFDASDYLKPWHFTENNGRLELTFEPAVDRYAGTNLGVIKSIAHQVFGWYSGKLVLDDGSTLQLNRLAGFAEDVLNHW